MRELFSHLGVVYSPSVNYLPLGRGVQSLRELFSHLGGVYSPSVNYLSTWEGCTVPP